MRGKVRGVGGSMMMVRRWEFKLDFDKEDDEPLDEERRIQTIRPVQDHDFLVM